MDLHKNIVGEEIDKCAEELRLLSRRIWKYAEQGGREEKSSKTLIRFFQKKNFKVTKNVAGLRYAFRADFGLGEFGGKSHPNVAFICQYDAVPGQGHIQGNNLLTEVSVAAALGLQGVIRASSTKIGRVTVVGCPNSQGGGLATLVNRKVFADVDVALAATPGPRTEWTPVYMARKTFRATYKRSERDVAQGSRNMDPLATAVLALNNIRGIQQHFGRAWEADGVISRGPRKPTEKIMESEATVRMRAPSNADMILIERRIVPCLEAASIASGCELDLSLGEKYNYSFISSPMMTYLLQLNAYHCGFLATPFKKPRGHLDPVYMGNLSHVIPAIRPMYFIGTDCEVGTREFKMALLTHEAQAYTIAIAKSLAMTAVDLLHTTHTITQAMADLQIALAQERRVKFKPFPTGDVREFKVMTEMPSDSNTGWSKRV